MTAVAGRARSLAWFALKLLVAAVALWLALRGVALASLRTALADVSIPWLGAAGASVAATLAAGVIRWRLLFYPDHASRSWRNLTYGLLIGQTINIALPLRLGEVARVSILSAAEHVAAARVIATIAVERLADLVVLGLATAMLLLLVAMPPWLRTSAHALLGAAAGALAVIALLAARGDVLFSLLERATRVLPGRLHARIAGQIRRGAEGLGTLRSPRASAALWTMSALIALLAASTNYLLFLAFGLALPAIAALFLLVVLQVGNTAVSVPGNLGVFHYLTILALAVYGVDRETALAYAIVLYAVAILPKLVLGAVIMAIGPKGFSFRAAFPSGPGQP